MNILLKLTQIIHKERSHFLAIKHTLTNLKDYKSYKGCSHTTMELYWKQVKKRYLETPLPPKTWRLNNALLNNTETKSKEKFQYIYI